MKRLTEDEVVVLRERAAAGEEYESIAKDFGRSASWVSSVATGKTYPKAGGPRTNRYRQDKSFATGKKKKKQQTGRKPRLRKVRRRGGSTPAQAIQSFAQQYSALQRQWQSLYKEFQKLGERFHKFNATLR